MLLLWRQGTLMYRCNLQRRRWSNIKSGQGSSEATVKTWKLDRFEITTKKLPSIVIRRIDKCNNTSQWISNRFRLLRGSKGHSSFVYATLSTECRLPHQQRYEYRLYRYNCRNTADDKETFTSLERSILWEMHLIAVIDKFSTNVSPSLLVTAVCCIQYCIAQ